MGAALIEQLQCRPSPTICLFATALSSKNVVMQAQIYGVYSSRLG